MSDCEEEPDAGSVNAGKGRNGETGPGYLQVQFLFSTLLFTNPPPVHQSASFALGHDGDIH